MGSGLSSDYTGFIGELRAGVVDQPRVRARMVLSNTSEDSTVCNCTIGVC
jgi:hypothetical protein